MQFATKIALVVRADLESWQKLNVTAFLASGIVGAGERLIGEPYRDADGRQYLAMIIQPMIVLGADHASLHRARGRAISRGVPVAVYIEDMFATGHDAANREVVSRYAGDALPLVGIGMRAERKVIDKITKGLRLLK